MFALAALSVFVFIAAAGYNLQGQGVVPRATAAVAQQTVPGATSAPAAPRAVFDKYCVTCHNQRLKTAGLTLDTLDLAHVAEKPDIWEHVVRKLRSGAMPPPGRPASRPR